MRVARLYELAIDVVRKSAATDLRPRAVGFSAKFIGQTTKFVALEVCAQYAAMTRREPGRTIGHAICAFDELAGDVVTPSGC